MMPIQAEVALRELVAKWKNLAYQSRRASMTTTDLRNKIRYDGQEKAFDVCAEELETIMKRFLKP